MTHIWDSHIHLFTEEMSSDPNGWADSSRESIWKACVSPPDRPSIQGWASVDNLLKDMDDAEVEKVVLLGWYWEHQTTCHLHNRFYADLIHRHPDRLEAFATIQPVSNSPALDEISWARDQGFKGIGEIHPQAQGFSLKDPCWQAVLEQIHGWDFPVNFHVTDPNTPIHPGKIETPLLDYVDMANTWPKQTFIFAHLGALIPLLSDTGLPPMRSENVYYDCAAIPLLYKAPILKDFADVVGNERILFGSDYPLRTFPRLQKRPDFKRSIRFVRESGLTEKQLADVFYNNARRLFTV